MLVLLILLADPVSVWGAELSSLVPLSSSQVKMVSEKVKVVLAEDSAVVQASYVFVNLGPAVKLQVAFPKQASMRGFVAKANGKKIKVNEGRFLFQEIYQDSTLRLPEGFEVAEEVFSWFGDNPWFVHQLSFGKGETLRLTHSYIVGVGSDSHTYGYREFRYYLRTGSLWAGVPETVEVDVRVDHVPAACFCGFGSPPIKPVSYVVSGDTLRWVWTNREPDQDIYIVFREPDALWMGKKLTVPEGLAALFDNDPGTGISLREGDSLFLVVGNPQALSMYAESDPERLFRIIPRFADSLSLRFTGLLAPLGEGWAPYRIVPRATCLLFCDTENTSLGQVFNLPAIAGNGVKEPGAWQWRCAFVGKPGKPLQVVGILVVAGKGTGILGEVEFYPKATGLFGETFWKENQRYFMGE